MKRSMPQTQSKSARDSGIFRGLHCKDWRSGGHENDPTAKEFECIASQLDSRDCDCACLSTLWKYINKRQGNCADGDAYWVKRCNDAYDAVYKKIYEKRRALHCPPGG